MSDLISRSEVIKALEECNLDKQLFEKDVFEKIYEIQTAYDIDKVVEELEELREMRDAIESNANALEQNGYNKGIDNYMNKLCNHCMQQTNECYKLECPFCTDGCDIVNIAEQLKAGESE